MDNKIALVLGATGGIGSEVATRLVAAGWQVRALHRNPDRVQMDSRLEWIRGDALVASDVAAAAEGTSLIVHAVNPPGYQNWQKLVLPMLDNTIAAAGANRARILLPGTIYNYSTAVFPDIHEDAPQNPSTRKGRIRAEMETRLRRAAEASQVRVLIVRAGDFFGARAANNWLGQGVIKPGQRPTVITYPGKPGTGHQWAYLPDVAETMLRLVEHADLPDFATFHMEGQWDVDGTQMVAAIQRVLGGKPIPVKRLPWFTLRLASPFVPLLRELTEVKYLWDQPVRLRNERLVALIGPEPRTPLDEALRTTLTAMKCL